MVRRSGSAAPLRPGSTDRYPTRSVHGSSSRARLPMAGQAGERACQGEAKMLPAAGGVTVAECTEDGRGEQMAGPVVQRLRGQYAGAAVGGGLDHGDSGTGLDEAVEAAPLGPGAGPSSGVQLSDDQAGTPVCRPPDRRGPATRSACRRRCRHGHPRSRRLRCVYTQRQQDRGEAARECRKSECLDRRHA